MRDGRGGRRGSGGRRGQSTRTGSAPRGRRSIEEKPKPLGAGVSEPEHAESLGASIAEATEKALQVLKATADEVEVTVLEEGKRGFLGIGMKRPYRVRVSWRKPPTPEIVREAPAEPAGRTSSRRSSEVDPPRRSRRKRPSPRDESPRKTETSRRQQTPQREETEPRAERPRRAAPLPRGEDSRPRRRSESQIDSTELNLVDLSSEQLGDLKREANSITIELLRLMGMSAEVDARIHDDSLRIAIESETDEALLIGRRGETRAALQQVINRVLSKRTGVFTPVLVDVAGYWERRVENLTQDAYALAERAISSGIKAQSEPLSPQERRVIHRALTDDDRVTTESVGRGLHKSVLVQSERTDPED